MKPFSRSDRVSGQVKKALSILLQKKINDPRLEAVTITSVIMSTDLRIAKIYFTISGTGNSMDKAFSGFKSSRGYLKRMLAGQLGLRYMPDLKFYYDKSFEHGTNIDNLLKTIKIEPDNGSNNTSFEKG